VTVASDKTVGVTGVGIDVFKEVERLACFTRWQGRGKN
jgi:hypothetical protein